MKKENPNAFQIVCRLPGALASVAVYLVREVWREDVGPILWSLTLIVLALGTVALMFIHPLFGTLLVAGWLIARR